MSSGPRAASPTLRSARNVTNYSVQVGGQPAGALIGLLFDDSTWEIRYLRIEQEIETKKVQFHILPQTVERFIWATQRIHLRQLEPVLLDLPRNAADLSAVA